MRYLVIGLLALLISPLARAGEADKKLDVYWTDVEGGAATLFVTPMGESILIDTGNPGARDPGRIFEIAKSAGLKQIDHLLITHYHGDHFGGAADLAKLIPIKTVYDNGQFPTLREKPTDAYLNFQCDKRVQVNADDMLPLKMPEDKTAPHVEFKILGCRKGFIDPPAGSVPNPLDDESHKRSVAEDTTDNANSIVSLISFGNFRLLVCGDLTWNIEAKLVTPVNLVGQVDVFQVTHHGLDLSNNPVVIHSVQPTVAIMSNGPTKGDETNTIATLRGTPSIKDIYQIHFNTRAAMKDNNVPADHIANNVGTPEGQIIKLNTDPTGKSYTVSVPSTKFEKTYQTKDPAYPEPIIRSAAPTTTPATKPALPRTGAGQPEANMENTHPAAYYTRASALFTEGQKDEAVFWFYVGQLRYRFHLSVAKNLDPSGDPALFGSLSEVVGRPLNEYAFGNIPKLAETIDKVLEWDAAHENGFTQKKGNEAALKEIREGLSGMKTAILKDQDMIKAQRKQNGLE